MYSSSIAFLLVAAVVFISVYQMFVFQRPHNISFNCCMPSCGKTHFQEPYNV